MQKDETVICAYVLLDGFDNSIVTPNPSSVVMNPYPPRIPGSLTIQFTANFQQQVDLTTAQFTMSPVYKYLFFSWVDACEIVGPLW